MARDLVVGNGRVLVNFDAALNMRDFYYPQVGSENHIMGGKNMVGIWADGEFSWVEEDGWRRQSGYLEDSLVTCATARNEEMGVELVVNDGVYWGLDIFLKRVVVKNLRPRGREIRLFFTHDFRLLETDIGDTALYDPLARALLHYKKRRVLLINGTREMGRFDQYTVAKRRGAGGEGARYDAEDGVLARCAAAQGSVDSAMAFTLFPQAYGQETVYYWIAAGEGFREVREMDNLVMRRGPAVLLEETAAFWRSWVNSRERGLELLDPRVAGLFKRSLLVMRTQVDSGGGILAASDSAILEQGRDHYSYVWPRDASFAACAMARAGYPEVARKFLCFCARVLGDDSFLWHKYNPDGSVGSTWHPWYRDGEVQLPIQEDETALVLLTLRCLYDVERDLEFISSVYAPLLRRTADFLADYRDSRTGLPLESYDLWEERRGVFTFTAAAVFAALRGAAEIAQMLGDRLAAAKYGQAAAEVREGILRHLYDATARRFVRGLLLTREGGSVIDDTAESSVQGVFGFGVLPAADRRVAATMKAVEESLWVRTRVGGLARYANDRYFRTGDYPAEVPGNPWFLCTCWLADWYIGTARNPDELARSLSLIGWVVNHATEAGLLPEQLEPYTGAPLSVSPLTWSHAGFVTTVMNYVRRAADFVRAGDTQPPAGR